ncbi:hypothetical protein FCO27_11240 [Bacillus pumilus]|uniref:hypothetical protein n=1 Tax=Bacillus pumilus TaxID=1408 RepID=UPI0010BE262B|nr:hypothetical protein [Bacillus pumilus]TKI23544.1 hypothetical protein FCO27_11240 [Bacillus pumilus]
MFNWRNIKDNLLSKLKKIFLPSKNLSFLLAQLLFYLFFIGFVLYWIIILMIDKFGIYVGGIEWISLIMVLFTNTFHFSIMFWFLKFYRDWNSKRDILFIDPDNQATFAHNSPQIDEMINEIKSYEESIYNWANEKNGTPLEEVEYLKIYSEIESGKKILKFQFTSIIVALLGILGSIITNKEIIEVWTNRYGLILEYVDIKIVTLIDIGTILMVSILIINTLLITYHKIIRKIELYERLLDKVILKFQKKENE